MLKATEVCVFHTGASQISYLYILGVSSRGTVSLVLFTSGNLGILPALGNSFFLNEQEYNRLL